MHIPTDTTHVIDLPAFSTALAQALQPSEEYDSREWLYVPNVYSEYRYLLGTRGAHPLICVGVNPSTARPGDLDNTLKSVERIAKGNGFDSFLMCNVYAQRATRPDDMEKECNQLLHAQNMEAFDYILSLETTTTPTIWAAWGAVIEKRGYLPDCVRDMIAVGQKYGARWCCAGARSKAGHPHHPLYLRKDSLLEDFDVESYLQTL